jgi:hypothetical protein
VLNFPIASTTLTVDPAEGPRYLFVASSNFDLRYNSSTLQSYDLAVTNAKLDELCNDVVVPESCRGPVPTACLNDPNSTECQAITEPAHTTCALVPRGSPQFELPTGVLRVCAVGPDDAHPSDAPLLVDEVRIGSFANGMELSPDQRRLYLPVRSDADLTRVDINTSGQMDCGGGFGTTDECDDAFRVSDRQVADGRDLSLPADPVAISVGPLSDFPGHTADEGTYIVMAHRQGQASLFIDPMPADPAVSLLDVLTGFPIGTATLVREPDTGLFWGSSATSGVIGRIGVALDASFTPDEVLETFLFDGGALVVPNIGSKGAPDFRDVAFDPRPGNRTAYVLSRVPPALVFTDRDVDFGPLLAPGLLPERIVRVGSGPSRIALEEVETSSGPRMLAFVSCFDSRDIHVVDVDLGQLVGVVREMSGPFEIEVDTVRKRLYVIDFRTSVIRIVDLEPMLECLGGTVAGSSQECSPKLVGLIGVPNAAEDLQ